MPKVDEFLVEQPSPAFGFMFGALASTVDGPIVLRFPGEFPPTYPAATCQVVDGNNQLLFTVYRAAGEPQPAFTLKPIRKPTIIRDAAGVVIGMYSSDQAKTPNRPGTSYSGYSSRPRFEGQAAAFTVENVPLYPWFKHWSGTEHCNKTDIFFYGAAPGTIEQPPAYEHKVWTHMGPPPYKFTTTAGAEKKGCAYGALDGGKHEVTVAKGMDAGMVVLAALGQGREGLIGSEHESRQ